MRSPVPRQMTPRQMDKIMANTHPEPNHHVPYSDGLRARYRPIGPASLLAALLCQPARLKASNSNAEGKEAAAGGTVTES
jgi:hypothetical protein